MSPLKGIDEEVDRVDAGRQEGTPTKRGNQALLPLTGLHLDRLGAALFVT